MQFSMVPLLLAFVAFAPGHAEVHAEVHAEAMSPIQKVISMIADLEGKTIAEGDASQKTYSEFSELCEERSKQLGFEVKTGKADAADLQATINKAVSDAAAFTAKIEELSSAIATSEADVKDATAVRAKEAADFAMEEKSDMETVNELSKSITVFEGESHKGGASMMQIKNAKNVAQAFAALVQASAMSSADAQRLTALVQSSSSNDDEDLAAPAGATYEDHSGGILDLLQSLLTKAEDSLAAARKKETIAIDNFEMLKLTLRDEIKYGGMDLDRAKKNLAGAKETQATAEGDLAVTSKDLAEDEKALSELHTDCMSKANAFEMEVKSRGEELKALATAKKVIVEATSGTSPYSFLQVVKSTDPAAQGFAAVHFVRRLAEKQKSQALAQLASRMSSAVENGDDPFAKVKGLIMGMIEKLQADAEKDASQKGYCDKELSESNAKKDDNDAEISKLSTKIDQMTAQSAKLKEEVAVLQKDLAELARTQVEMDKLRSEEKSEFVTAKSELEQGVAGIKMALKVLRDYYAGEASHEASSDAGAGIISMLEVCESDFTKSLQETVSVEETSESAYEKDTKENEVEKATKDQDAKYKIKEAKGLDESVAQLSSDKSGVQEELDAVSEYLAKLKEQCVAKPEPYEERKARREAEIAGLKEALSVLEGEAVLLQKRIASTTLRGARK